MDEKMMQEAIRVAADGVAKGHGGPFGCVIVKDGKIIGEGSNMVFATNDPTAHAEVVAIRGASKQLGTAELTGCEIYCSGEPCPMCLAAIYWARIEKVYFASTKEDAAKIGFDDSFIYRELSLPISERTMSMQQVPQEAVKELFNAWDKFVDKTDLPQS